MRAVTPGVVVCDEDSRAHTVDIQPRDPCRHASRQTRRVCRQRSPLGPAGDWDGVHDAGSWRIT